MRKKNDTVLLQKFLAEKHLAASSFSAPFHWMRKQAPCFLPGMVRLVNSTIQEHINETARQQRLLGISDS